MKAKLAILTLYFSISAPVSVFAQTGAMPKLPCQHILETCKLAGFVSGGEKTGTGLFADCVDPIMRGVKQPAGAGRPLPVVSEEEVAACKVRDPNFGHDKESSVR